MKNPNDISFFEFYLPCYNIGMATYECVIVFCYHFNEDNLVRMFLYIPEKEGLRYEQKCNRSRGFNSSI